MNAAFVTVKLNLFSGCAFMRLKLICLFSPLTSFAKRRSSTKKVENQELKYNLIWLITNNCNKQLQRMAMITD